MPSPPRTPDHLSGARLSLPAAARLDPPSGDYDALADLFLGDGPAAPPAPAAPLASSSLGPAASRPAAAPAPADHARSSAHFGSSSRAVRAWRGLDLLIQGHLPVRAAPWSSQYCRLRADAERGPIALVRLSPGAITIDLFAADAGADAFSPAASLADAWRRLRATGAALVLQSQEIDQPSLAADPRVASLTLLTGANEAAIVAAYRTLKALSDEGNRRDEPIELRVCLVGSDEQASEAGAAKLRRAATTFLERPLDYVGCISKVAPTGSRTLFRGESNLGLSDVLDELVQSERPDVHAHEAYGPSQHAAKQPHAAPAQADAQTGAQPARSLAAHVPGLRLLAARFPEDPSIELALDERNVLHLLRENRDGTGYERLAAAAAWARKHGQLLAMTPGAASLDASSLPVLHLFTSAPRSVRHLLDTDLKLHAVAPPAGVGALDLN